jgi:hypothetical protein
MWGYYLKKKIFFLLYDNTLAGERLCINKYLNATYGRYPDTHYNINFHYNNYCVSG